MKRTIEAEGGELVLRNSKGDVAVIPAKYRKEVQGMIMDGCHNCIDDFVSKLPTMQKYAQDGTLIPDEPDWGSLTVRELYEKKVGKPWTTAKQEGLTTGTYEANMALRKQLLDGTFGVPEAPTEEIAQATQPVHFTSEATNFSDAFRTAREKLGADQVFEYKGKLYGTNYGVSSTTSPVEPTSVSPQPTVQPTVQTPVTPQSTGFDASKLARMTPEQVREYLNQLKAKPNIKPPVATPPTTVTKSIPVPPKKISQTIVPPQPIVESITVPTQHTQPIQPRQTPAFQETPAPVQATPYTPTPTEQIPFKTPVEKAKAFDFSRFQGMTEAQIREEFNRLKAYPDIKTPVVGIDLSNVNPKSSSGISQATKKIPKIPDVNIPVVVAPTQDPITKKYKPAVGFDYSRFEGMSESQIREEFNKLKAYPNIKPPQPTTSTATKSVTQSAIPEFEEEAAPTQALPYSKLALPYSDKPILSPTYKPPEVPTPISQKKLDSSPSFYKDLTEDARYIYDQQIKTGRSFTIIDKPTATIYLVDEKGQAQSYPVLLGKAIGDEPNTHTGAWGTNMGTTFTPPGVYEAQADAKFGLYDVMITCEVRDSDGDVSKEYSIAIHPPSVEAEDRLRRLQSPDSKERRVTHGCIVVSPEVWNKHFDKNWENYESLSVSITRDDQSKNFKDMKKQYMNLKGVPDYAAANYDLKYSVLNSGKNPPSEKPANFKKL